MRGVVTGPWSLVLGECLHTPGFPFRTLHSPFDIRHSTFDIPMVLCQVTGNVVATRKHERLRRAQLLIVQPVDTEGRPDGSGDMLALDPKFDAGVGDYVLIAKEGDVVKQLLDTDDPESRTPANVVIIAVVDEWEVRT
jgi:microcompartment protein CcmK/EutM